LSEIGRWGSGGTPKSSDPSFYNGSIPWIRSGDLPDGAIIEHKASITEKGLNSCSAKWIEPNSVLIAMYGATIGKVGITTYPVTTNQAVAFVKPHDGVDPRYIFNYLRARKSDFIGLALQLSFFEVGTLSGGLVSSAPE
jgi:type I restriction enzyme S subunit